MPKKQNTLKDLSLDELCQELYHSFTGLNMRLDYFVPAPALRNDNRDADALFNETTVARAKMKSLVEELNKRFPGAFPLF